MTPSISRRFFSDFSQISSLFKDFEILIDCLPVNAFSFSYLIRIDLPIWVIRQHHHHDANRCKIQRRIVDKAITNSSIIFSRILER